MKRSLTLALLGVLFMAAKPVSADAVITLNQANPAYEDTLTFTITGLDHRYDCNGHRKCARVDLYCYQGDTLVFGQGGSLGQARGDGNDIYGYNGFYLESYVWVHDGSGADCTATLFRFDNSGPVQTRETFATLAFHATG